MKTLSSSLRRLLERTVIEARDVAETGARAALTALAVQHHEPYGHMTPEQRSLRRRLRAHGRQLGDRRDTRSGTQAIDHLVHECAFEHWHGMLFARFLAENYLLIEPEGVAITLDECEALAKEEDVDKWALAARFAHRMLPQVFRPDHPALEVRFAPEHRLKLENLVEGLPNEVFTATDSLGWVYQFWQSRKKDEVNRSEVRIGADELPTVTQLFTEPYMVQFLLDNSLGAWWVSRYPDKACPVDLTYLRKTEGATPATGSFRAWPDELSEFRLLDPCCGSGHFLVAALLMLVPVRMALEGLAARKAVDAVLRENLHGLELDPRCVELAAFVLALAAWTYSGAEGYRPLPELNLACSGLAPNATKEEWAALSKPAAAAGGLPPNRDLFGVDDNLLSAQLRDSLEALHDLFEQAPLLGSLIDPRVIEATLYQRDYESARKLFAAVLQQERIGDEQTERVVAAQGMARAADLLAERYHLVITNVPFLARGKQSETLRAFCARHYPTAKNDLATVFLERCLRLCTKGGTASLVLPQNWLFLTTYRKLREKLLKAETWHLLARLGEGGFDSPAAAGAFVALLTLSRGNPAGNSSGMSGSGTETNTMYGLDVSDFRTAIEKAARLPMAELKGVEQVRQLKNPDFRITFSTQEVGALLNEVAECYQGIVTGDIERFTRKLWEVILQGAKWVPFRRSNNSQSLFGDVSEALLWESGTGSLHSYANAARGRLHDMHESGNRAWGRHGVAINRMRGLRAVPYYGERFDNNVAVVFPKFSSGLVAALYAFLSDDKFHQTVRELDRAIKVTNQTLLKVSFDAERWLENAVSRNSTGLPLPHSNDPTQWVFHGHPCGSVIWHEAENRTDHGQFRTDGTVLQIAVARLLGYRWPAEQDAQMELADEQRDWVRRCETLLAWADEDGIVCIPPIRGEPPAGDRLLGLLAAAFGDDWNDGVVIRLLAEAGSATLDDWLRDRFFDLHCKLFHHRPFVWHIWDGRRRDGFHALVSYHKLAEGDGNGRRLLESLTYSYLGDWLTRQQDGVRRGEGGAEDRLAAALELQTRLAAILQGEPPFDIFVRWKPIEEQPIGWAPDIDDGVRLNIRPFMANDIPGGKKGAGLLRTKPNVHWRKDRGKEPFREQERFRWFWNDGEFTGERLNDIHLTNAEKRAARERAGTK